MDASTSPPADSVPHHLYRFVGPGGEPPIADTDFRYSLPTRNADGTYTPGAWTPPVTGLIPCDRGYHAVRVQDLPWWIGLAGRSTLYRVEARGRVLSHEDKLVCEQLRLLAPVETLTSDVLRAWAVDCAEHVLPVYERIYPGDDRTRRCIETARNYLAGTATRAELETARSAVYAASDAAYAAADAARAAADAAYAARASIAAADAAYAAIAADAAYAAYAAAIAADAAYAAAYAARASIAADAAADAAIAADAAYAAAYAARASIAADAAADAAIAADAAYAAADAADAAADAADAAADAAQHQERLWQAQRLAELLGLPWDGPEVAS